MTRAFHPVAISAFCLVSFLLPWVVELRRALLLPGNESGIWRGA